MLQLRGPIRQCCELVATACGISALMIAISAVGLMQPVELFFLDLFFRTRASSEVQDPRILIVTIGEADIDHLGEWPLPDETLAKLLSQIYAYQPRGIGLDIYRNLPVGSGYNDLEEVYRTTPVLVGVEKVIGERVSAPIGLASERQVGMSDVVVDDDGRVRRGLLSVMTPDGEEKLGLGTRLALIYLEQENIFPELVNGRLHLGQAVLQRFKSNDGGYAKADDGGTQILINFPAGHAYFETVSLTDILTRQVPPEKIKDRVVLIGSTAISLNDFFYTPMSLQEESPGVFIHAHIVSQLLGSALDGRTVLKGANLWSQWLWIGLASNLSAAVIAIFLQQKKRYRAQNILVVALTIFCLGGVTVVCAYGLFSAGLWLPVAAPLLSIASLSTLSLVKQNQKLYGLASLDELTQIANRRTFDQSLQQATDRRQDIALVLCDIDYFKRYNDTYGHQAGDKCLHAVAQAIKQGARRSDLVARYGGEEFAIIFPNTSLATANEVLLQIKQRVAQLEIAHQASEVSPYVTLSFGLAATTGLDLKDFTPQLILKKADEVLYDAKRQGRNQIVSAYLSSS